MNCVANGYLHHPPLRRGRNNGLLTRVAKSTFLFGEKVCLNDFVRAKLQHGRQFTNSFPHAKKPDRSATTIPILFLDSFGSGREDWIHKQGVKTNLHPPSHKSRQYPQTEHARFFGWLWTNRRVDLRFHLQTRTHRYSPCSLFAVTFKTFTQEEEQKQCLSSATQP